MTFWYWTIMFFLTVMGLSGAVAWARKKAPVVTPQSLKVQTLLVILLWVLGLVAYFH